MAVGLKEKSVGTLVLVVIIGILIGSYLNTILGLLLPDNNVVRTLFTYNFINFGVGFPHAVILDLDAIKLQFGMQMKFSLMSVVGVFMSLYFFRWYK